MALDPEHLAHLQKSGLTNSTIEAEGFRSALPEDIKRFDGVLSALKISYHDIKGEPTGHSRLRLHPPYINGEGKVQKYWQAPGSDSDVFLSRLVNWLTIAPDPTKDVDVTEGEKKASAGCQAGLSCIGIPGVWNWFQRLNADERIVVPAFGLFRWQGRKVRLIPDSDVWKPEKFNALCGFFALGMELVEAGAHVEFLKLPESGQGKVGLDDYLLKHKGDKETLNYLERISLTDSLLKKVIKWWQRWRKKQAAQAKGTVVTIPFSQIRLESVGWVWDRRIPTKMLTGIIGDPEQGKSTFLAWLAAQASQGQLAGEYAGKPVGVCVCSAEDSPASVIGPRLTIAGADMDRVHLMEFRDENNLARGVRFPDDGAAVQTRMEATGSKLLLVDPLVAHLPTELNSWRDQDIRVALSAMARLAEELGAAVIFLCHLNKNSSVPNPFYRIGSSIGIPAAARSILWAAPDPLDPTNEYAHVLLHLKCNVAEKAPTLRYGTESHVLSGGIKTSRILWAGEAPAIKADDLMQPPHENQKHLGALAEAKQWLEGILGSEGKEAAFILKEAVKVGISERTLNRAKKDLGIKPQFNGKDHLWMWVLPAKAEGPDSQDPVSQTSGNLALSHKITTNNINHIEQGCQAAKMAKVDSDGNLVGSLASDLTNSEGPTL